MWTACYNRAVTFCQQKKWAATKWKFASYVDTLAAAYAEAGDFDSAIRYGEKAIETAGTEPEETFALATQLFSKRDAMELANKAAKEVEPLRQRFRLRLELYKQHLPYRETASH
jgi:tetratricopeptide (TPR) repeat protein